MFAITLISLMAFPQFDSASLSLLVPDVMESGQVSTITTTSEVAHWGGKLSNDKTFVLMERKGDGFFLTPERLPAFKASNLQISCKAAVRTIKGEEDASGSSLLGLLLQNRSISIYIQQTEANSADTPYEDKRNLDLLARFYISCLKQPALQDHSQQTWAGTTIKTALCGNRNVFNATLLFNLRPSLPELTGSWGGKTLKILPGYTKAKIDNVDIDCPDVPILAQGEIWLDQSFLEHLNSN